MLLFFFFDSKLVQYMWQKLCHLLLASGALGIGRIVAFRNHKV